MHGSRALGERRSTSWPVKLGRMNERILRIEDHKGRIVRRGPAQTAALTRRGNTHHVLPMSLDCSVTHVPGRSSWRSRRWGDDAGRRRRATMGRLAWRTRSSGTRRSSETAFERAVPQGGGLRSSSRATSSITVESGSVRASSDSCNNAPISCHVPAIVWMSCIPTHGTFHPTI